MRHKTEMVWMQAFLQHVLMKPGVVECFVSAVERCGKKKKEEGGLPEVVGVCLPVCVFSESVLHHSAGGAMQDDKSHRRTERGRQGWEGRRMGRWEDMSREERRDHEYRWGKRGRQGVCAGRSQTPGGGFTSPIMSPALPTSRITPFPSFSPFLSPPCGTLTSGRRWLFREDWSRWGEGQMGGTQSVGVEDGAEWKMLWPDYNWNEMKMKKGVKEIETGFTSQAERNKK